jgi:RNA polymerase sigma-70 factor (ECF subfamily)
MKKSKAIIFTDKIEVVEDDKHIIFGILNNTESFGKIMNKYSPKISRYIYRIVGSSFFEIDDLLQNIFIKVYKNLNHFDDSLSFSSWIYRIAHNEAIDYIRKMKIRPRRAVSEEEENFILNIPDLNINIPEESNNNLVKDQILKILSKMKEKYKMVLILRFLEEKDYNEISDILKIPLGTVATLIHRAKEEFKIIAEKNNLKLKYLE